MMPFKVRPLQALIYALMVFLTFQVGGCDGCWGCDEDGCPFNDDDVGCECDLGENDELKNCEPGGCDITKDLENNSKYKWTTVDKCYSGETKFDACNRLNNTKGGSSVKCDGTVGDADPTIEVTVSPNLTNYHVGKAITLRAVAKDINEDVVELRFDFNNGKGIKYVVPSEAEGEKFLNHPAIHSEPFTPTEPGCYKTRVTAVDEKHRTSAGGAKDLSVGGSDMCSGNSDGTKRQEIRFLAPPDNKSFPAEYPVQLTVSVRAQLGDEVTRVEFLLGTQVLSSQNAGRYEGNAEYKWIPALTDVGEHTLTAKAYYSKLATPGETSIKVRITKGSDNLPIPNFTFPPVTTLGRMYSTRFTIPATGSGLPIDDAAIRMGNKYCKLLNSAGSTCPMYPSESAVFAEAQLDNLESINDADFLIIKEPDGRTFTVYGLATPLEFADYQKGIANLTLELEGSWNFPMKLVSTDPERAKKDEYFNQMIEFTLDLLKRPDPEKPIVVSALAKKSAADFAPRTFEYLATMCLKDLFTGAAKGMKFAETGTRVLTAAQLNLVVGYTRGIFEGVWGGIRDDYDGLKELVKFVWSPIDRSFELFHGIRLTLDEIGKNGFEKFVDGIFESIQNTMYDFLSTADRTVLWRVEGAGNLAIEVGLRAYIAGYVSGYLTEQLAVVVTGAGAAAKAGKLVQTLIKASRAGQVAMGTVTAANAFNKRLWHWATHQMQRAKDLKTVAEANLRLEDLRKLIKEFRDANRQMAFELGERYADWREKVAVMVTGTADNWTGAARTALLGLVEINRRVVGEALSALAATGWLNVYSRLADLPAKVDGFFDYLTTRWLTDESYLVLRRLEEVFQKMDKDLPLIVKSASTGIGKRIKMRGVRIYYMDLTAVPPIRERYKVFYRHDYRFSAKADDPALSRGDTYIADDFATAFYELRQSVGGKQAIIVEFEIDNVLDITDPAVVASFRVDGKALDMDLLTSRYEDASKYPNPDVGKKLIYDYGQKVADAAIALGYRGILYPSAQVKGKTNIVLFGGKYDSGDITVLSEVPTSH